MLAPRAFSAVTAKAAVAGDAVKHNPRNRAKHSRASRNNANLILNRRNPSRFAGPATETAATTRAVGVVAKVAPQIMAAGRQRPRHMLNRRFSHSPVPPIPGATAANIGHPMKATAIAVGVRTGKQEQMTAGTATVRAMRNKMAMVSGTATIATGMIETTTVAGIMMTAMIATSGAADTETTIGNGTARGATNAAMIGAITGTTIATNIGSDATTLRIAITAIAD